jgi:hypothetical protein
MKYIHIWINELGEVTKNSIEDVEVAAQNEQYIIINDAVFTKIQKKKDKYNHYPTVEEVYIRDHSKDSFWSKFYGIFNIQLYTDVTNIKAIETKINKAFNKWVQSKVSVYLPMTKINIKLNLEKGSD